MATVTKDFRVKNGIVVEGSTATVNGHDVLTKAIADAKGDLLVGTADNAISRLAAGTNGYVLTADSSATEGIKWAAAPAVGSFETSIVFEGSTADSYETTLTVTDPTADRTITLPNVSGTVITTGDAGTVTSTMIENGTIVDGDISASAAIGASKIAGTAVTQADSGTVTSTMIANDTIVDADINSAAAIAQSKIANLTTDLGNKASASDLTTHTGATEAHGATGAVVGTTNTQTLTNKTLQDPTIIIGVGTTITNTEIGYLDGVTSGIQTQLNAKAATADKLSVFAATSSSELAGIISDETGTGALVFANTPTLVTPNIGAATGTSLVLSGDLTVNGTTTTINSTEITIDDKNLVLGAVATPSDAGADGGGITLKGATDKTLNWVDATDAWTSSEHVNLASGKELKIAGTSVLSGSTLGSGVTGSSLTSVGTITSGTWNGSTIAVANGGTGITSFGAGIADFLGTPSSANLRTAVTDETGTGALVFANTPTLVTPNIGAATATSLTLTDALIGTATQALTGGTATVVDSWSGTTYSSAKYLVQMKKGTEIQTLEVLINVDGSNNVAITEYADVINAEASLGTTDADYSGGNVRLLVTASDGTTVKVHKTLIEA